MINEILKYMNITDDIDIKKYESSQNNVYNIIGNNYEYTIKVYSKDAIKDDNDYNYREEQFLYAEELSKKGVNVILPIKIDNKYIHNYKGIYFAIYYTFKGDNSINYKNLVYLFHQLHLIKNNYNLKNHYKKINLDIPQLKELITNNNNYLNENIELVIGHNDFKPLNILWKDEMPYVIDFDASGYSNEDANVIEFALNFCYKDGNTDFITMKYIFDEYKKIVGRKLMDFDKAFALSLNGKLSWLEYLFKVDINDAKHMIKSLMSFQENKEKIRSVYDTN